MYISISHHLIKQSDSFIKYISFSTRQRFEKLKNTISIFQNYQGLRRLIRKAEPPFLPCLPIITKDLTQIDYLLEDQYEQNGVVYENINKLSQIVVHLDDIYRMKNEAYSYDIKPNIYEFLDVGYKQYLGLFLNDIENDKNLDI